MGEGEGEKETEGRPTEHRTKLTRIPEVTVGITFR